MGGEGEKGKMEFGNEMEMTTIYGDEIFDPGVVLSAATAAFLRVYLMKKGVALEAFFGDKI